MTKVTLARIHALIQNHSEKISDLWGKIDDLKNTFSCRIFEKTTQSDLDAQTQKMTAEKQAFFDIFNTIKVHSAYIGYLKKELQKGNHKHGVSEMLQEVKNYGKLIDIIERASSRAGARGYVSFENIHPVDFYKSSFTENNKIYDLTASIFSNADEKEFSLQMDSAKKQLADLNDRIAAVNQSKCVNIAEFDEFKQNPSKNWSAKEEKNG